MSKKIEEVDTAAPDRERRNSLTRILAGSALVGSVASVPERWVKPAVDTVMLPAHGATTGPGGDSGSGTTAPPVEDPPRDFIYSMERASPSLPTADNLQAPTSPWFEHALNGLLPAPAHAADILPREGYVVKVSGATGMAEVTRLNNQATVLHRGTIATSGQQSLDRIDFCENLGGGGSPTLTVEILDYTLGNSFLVIKRFSNGKSDDQIYELPMGSDINLAVDCTQVPSDVNAKENVSDVDGREILDRLAKTPVRYWNYIDDDSGARHIGPMAQDFAHAFGVGSSDKRIHVADGQGVALASIQALYDLLQEKDERIGALEKQLEDLARRIDARTD